MAEANPDYFILKLYITGLTVRSQSAIDTLKKLCNAELQGRYELEIIDVLENPQLAENERILATPTLIRELPPPLRRLIGDLSNTDRVLLGLDLVPRGPVSAAN